MKEQNPSRFPWQPPFAKFVGTALLMLVGLSIVILIAHINPVVTLGLDTIIGSAAIGLWSNGAAGVAGLPSGGG